ncbi:MAG: gamma-glutamylcyclotransferase family protein [Candidatus Thiodiazotropha taylori]|nr:gamma-glutamylcyclotransferase [Candidatus Thiodiazotropha taylori]MCW4323799.1 gamma-glutamylcyclotransferase [Candidatus Thiodiazotropha taylori]
MKSISRVFVYGTLRKNQVNHDLLSSATYLGDHQTQPVYKMFHLGSYPGVVKSGSTSISGEVYLVDALTMSQLDRLEGYPNAYTRELIPTPWGQAWIYLYRGSLQGRQIIQTGRWHDEINWRRWSR